MILSDNMILQEMEKGNIIIDGFKEEHLNPNSVDLTLAPTVKIYPRKKISVATYEDLPYWVKASELYTRTREVDKSYVYEAPLDPRAVQKTIELEIPEEGYVLVPGEVYLYACNERIGVKNDICCQVQAKSSLGRLGLDIVIGPAGFVDTGFEGSLVLELRATRPIIVYPNMKICQIKFERVQGEILESYDKKSGSKYMNQTGVQESLMHMNFQVHPFTCDGNSPTCERNIGGQGALDENGICPCRNYKDPKFGNNDSKHT